MMEFGEDQGRARVTGCTGKSFAKGAVGFLVISGLLIITGVAAFVQGVLSARVHEAVLIAKHLSQQPTLPYPEDYPQLLIVVVLSLITMLLLPALARAVRVEKQRSGIVIAIAAAILIGIMAVLVLAARAMATSCADDGCLYPYGSLTSIHDFGTGAICFGLADLLSWVIVFWFNYLPHRRLRGFNEGRVEVSG
jgi:hypothetical protein